MYDEKSIALIGTDSNANLINRSFVEKLGLSCANLFATLMPRLMAFYQLTEVMIMIPQNFIFRYWSAVFGHSGVIG